MSNVNTTGNEAISTAINNHEFCHIIECKSLLSHLGVHQRAFVTPNKFEIMHDDSRERVRAPVLAPQANRSCPKLSQSAVRDMILRWEDDFDWWDSFINIDLYPRPWCESTTCPVYLCKELDRQFAQ